MLTLSDNVMRRNQRARHESNLDGVGKLWKIAGQLGREKIEREIRITSMERILTTEIHQDSCRRQIQEEKKHRHLLSTSLSNWTRSTYFPVSDLWRKWTSVLLSSRFWINLVHSKILLSGAPHLPFDHIHQPKKHLWYNVDSLWRLDQRLWMVKKAMGKQSFFFYSYQSFSDKKYSHNICISHSQHSNRSNQLNCKR